MQNVILMPAFVLHARRFHETSLILDVFSQQEGRVGLLAKGAYRPKNKMAALLQPFSPLLLSWRGRSELMTLTQVEAAGLPYTLIGNRLVCGFYLNEILIRVLKQNDTHAKLYEIYLYTLKNLSQSVNIQSVLRIFEKHLLTELGYALPLTIDLEGNSIGPTSFYQFIPYRGFKRETGGADRIKGESILALAQEQLHTNLHFQDAKRLLQWALAPILGPKPLKSRELLCY